MIWGPFAIAIAVGALISLAIYFLFVWPRREPPAQPEAGGSDESA